MKQTFLLALMGLLLVACGGGGDDDDLPEPTPEPTPEPKFESKSFTAGDVTFTMVAVEGGTFLMGAREDDATVTTLEKPQHEVTLSDFYIAETEVTQALWKAVTGSNPSHFAGDRLPVEKVSWDDCQTFITQLNALTGHTFRLPTEAEWEYAARGGNKSQGYPYSGSTDFKLVAWYSGNSESQTHEVGTKAANELGIFDMSGNVYEWCQDGFGGYSSKAQTDPTGPETGSNRVIRGGCWDNGAWYIRVLLRDKKSHEDSSELIGLRLAMSR